MGVDNLGFTVVSQGGGVSITARSIPTIVTSKFTSQAAGYIGRQWGWWQTE